LSFLPPGQLIPVDVSKYDQRIVLEALHNCIAHQDYSQCAKVIVVERVGELEFRSVGSFYDGTPEDYISNNRIPSRYRNPFLAEAMLQLRMMDTMGLGIREVMFRGQAKRYLPMPDYDTADQNQVVMRLAGRFIDENYSRALLIHQDLSLSDMCALDRVQKNQTIDAAAVQSLRKRELIEGRKNALHVSAAVADVTDQKAQYIRNRSQGDEHYRKLILDYLDKFNQASLRELKEMLEPLLPDVLGNKQKLIKIRNLLTWLREKELIRAEGSKKNAIWRSAKPDKNN
jgi:ATP-dependent DNA helicase RecG